MKHYMLAAAFAACAAPGLAQQLPGMTGIDHIGFTVPNLDEAVTFFGDILGCQAFYPLGPFAGG